MRVGLAVKNSILVDVYKYEGVCWAVADLHGECHYDLWQMYQKLPNVIEVEGRLYGKSGWDSDKEKAYYRTDMIIAKGV